MPETDAATLRARANAYESWAVTNDRNARTAATRRAFDRRFEQQVDSAGELASDERALRAAHARSPISSTCPPSRRTCARAAATWSN